MPRNPNPLQKSARISGSTSSVASGQSGRPGRSNSTAVFNPPYRSTVTSTGLPLKNAHTLRGNTSDSDNEQSGHHERSRSATNRGPSKLLTQGKGAIKKGSIPGPSGTTPKIDPKARAGITPIQVGCQHCGEILDLLKQLKVDITSLRSEGRNRDQLLMDLKADLLALRQSSARFPSTAVISQIERVPRRTRDPNNLERY